MSNPSTKATDVTATEAGISGAHPHLAELQEMLQAGVHFGHRTSRWSPKMQPYIHGTKGTVHVVNLEKTLEKLAEAEAFLEKFAKEGRIILFVGTKPSAKTIVEEEAKRCGMPHVTNRWLGGTLTNFKSISGRLKHFLDLEEKQQKGELAKYTKKEQLDFAKELKDLEGKFGGIKYLTKAPDALVVIDITKETTAVREARRTKVPVVALVDTNADPSLVTHPIPSNDDAITAVAYMAKRLADAVLRGKTALMQSN